MSRPELTTAGHWYAVKHSASSIVARIALQGYSAGWPNAHVASAVEACNRAALEV